MNMLLSVLAWIEKDSTTPYGKARRTFTYGLCASLPLVIIYHLGLPLVNEGLPPNEWVVNGAYSMVQWVGSLFGVLPPVFGDIMLLGGIALAIIYERKHLGKIPIHRNFFLMTINEAVSLALIVGVLSYSLTRFFLYVPELLSVGNENGVRELTAPLYHYLIQSCGDGFFEELLFRVIGVGGLIALFRHAKIMPDIASVIVALLIVSFGFSYIHYLSPVLQESFTPESFIRRSLLGFLLGVVYLWRGFGTAAWTHTFINAFIYASAFYSAS